MNNNETFFPKRSSAFAAVCVLLCIPLIAAIILVATINPKHVETDALKSLTVSINGIDKTFNDEASIKLYSDMIKYNATEISLSKEDFSGETPYTVTFTETDGNTSVYNVYMREDNSDCIYHVDGKYFVIDSSVADRLLVRSEFGDVNTAAFMPVLSFTRKGQTLKLSPSSYTWSYKALDGSTVHASPPAQSAVKNETIKLDISDIGAFSFSVEPDNTPVVPDSLKLHIQNGADTIFNDELSKLADNLSLMPNYKSDTKLTFTITAEWFDLADKEERYSGTLTYVIPALYDIKPTYSLVDQKPLPQGDFTVLRMSDFNDNETLEIDNDFGIPSPAKVYDLEGQNVKIAFIPFASTSTLGEHTLTLKTKDADVQTKKVSVKEPRSAFSTQTVTVTQSAGQLQEVFTSEAVEEWSGIALKYTEKSQNAQLWEGKFSYPTGSSQTVSGAGTYGMTRTVRSLKTHTYVVDGTSLLANEGDTVKSANSGKVLLAGQTKLMGNTVIVDHGSGVLSYYGHLSEISVKEGDEVGKEAPIGKAGSTGFACKNTSNGAEQETMVYFGVSIGGVFIDPSSPCRWGINF